MRRAVSRCGPCVPCWPVVTCRHIYRRVTPSATSVHFHARSAGRQVASVRHYSNATVAPPTTQRDVFRVEVTAPGPARLTHAAAMAELQSLGVVISRRSLRILQHD
eukprot:EG_transcript_67598